MRKLVPVVLILVLAAGTSLAAGGKVRNQNHGTKGKGQVHQTPQSDNGTAKAPQQRSGR